MTASRGEKSPEDRAAVILTSDQRVRVFRCRIASSPRRRSWNGCWLTTSLFG